MKRHTKLPLIVVLLVAFSTFVNCTEKLFTSAKNNRFVIQPAAKYNWFDARKECANRNMELLTIETEEKSKEVKEMLNKVFTGKRTPRFYLGANDYPKFRNFSWLTSSGRVNFTYTNWEKTEPNNYMKLGEHCVHMGFHGTDEWNDIYCGRKYGFICQEKSDFLTLLNEISRA